jgi:hypothetical protein
MTDENNWTFSRFSADLLDYDRRSRDLIFAPAAAPIAKTASI